MLLCLLAGGLALLAGGRPWVTGTQPVPPPLPPRHLTLTATGLHVPVRYLALLALAAVPAIVATRGRGRRLVGVVGVLTGAGITAVSWQPLHAPRQAVRAVQPFTGAVSASPWPALAVLAGLLLVGGGALVAVRGGRWALLSTRYEAPAVRAERRAATEVAVWDALDRGEDPTRAERGEDPAPD